MNALKRTFSSSVGSKVVMAVTGLALVGFVLSHMAGNLQMFVGRTALNDYAEKLQNLGPLLWVARIGLLAVFAAHVGAALRITAANKAARPVPYRSVSPQVTSFAARTMFMSGIIVLLFVLFHLAHFTLGWVQGDLKHMVETVGEHTRPDVYGMTVTGFGVWWVTLLYVAANLVLAVHISHGASSLFQSLGFTHARFEPLKQHAGKLLGLLIGLGNISMPLACLLGVVKA